MDNKNTEKQFGECTYVEKELIDLFGPMGFQTFIESLRDSGKLINDEIKIV